MKLYVVEALRWGDRENHSYVVGVYSSLKLAKRVARQEHFYRGCKYDCEVKAIYLDQVNKDYDEL